MAGRLKLGQLLISKGLIGPEQLASALAEQERWGSRLGITLVRLGFLDENVLLQTLAQQLQLPVARIAGKTVNTEVLALVPGELAEKYRCLPLFTREEAGGEVLFVGMEDPSDLAAVDELKFRIEHDVRTVLVAPTELEEALQRHYHGSGAQPTAPPAVHETLPKPPAPKAPDPAAAPARVLPPMQGADPAPALPDDTDSDTEPQLPPMDPVLDGLEEGDPLGLDLPDDDPNGMSFSAAGEAPLVGLDEAPFGDSDPEIGGFADAPFGVADDDPFGDLGEDPLAGDPGASASEPAAPAPAREAAGGSLEGTVLMQALAQLLVEKGVIGRGEFADRVRRIAAKTAKS